MSNTIWDVLIAGAMVTLGVSFLIRSSAPESRILVRISRSVAALGFISYGIGIVTLGRYQSAWLFMLACAGVLIETFCESGAKWSSLFPTFFRRRDS